MEIKKRVGRPVIMNNSRQYLLNFSNDDEAELLVKAKEKALEWGVPLKAIFIAALQKWVHGEVTYGEIKSGSKEFVIIKKETVQYKKRPTDYIDIIKQEDWYEDWLKQGEKIIRNVS
jgi:hypothetical protein